MTPLGQLQRNHSSSVMEGSGGSPGKGGVKSSGKDLPTETTAKATVAATTGGGGGKAKGKGGDAGRE